MKPSALFHHCEGQELSGEGGGKAEAVAAQQQFNDVYAYPNPVRPEYNGIIAIKGFMQQSEVKITDASGNLVFSTVSIGGQAVWNGKTLDGNRKARGESCVLGARAGMLIVLSRPNLMI